MIRARAGQICLLLALVTAWPAAAQDEGVLPAPMIDSEDVVEIDGSGGSTGRAAVNAAAGNLNQQANIGVIATGDTAIAIGSVTQITDAPASAPSAYKSVTITETAFAGSNGMIAVNAVAGSANQQANLAVIAIGIEGRIVTDAMLSQTRASSSPSGGTEQAVAPEVAAGVSPGAFAGSSGLVQVSLVGGEGNSSANIFALTSSAGTDP